MKWQTCASPLLAKAMLSFCKSCCLAVLCGLVLKWMESEEQEVGLCSVENSCLSSWEWVYAVERVAKPCTDTAQRRMLSWWGQEGSQGWKWFISHQANPCMDLSPCPLFLRTSSCVKHHGESASPWKHLCCFYVGVSGSTKVGKDHGGAACKNTLGVLTRAGLLILLGLERHLVIRLKQLNWVLWTQG